MKPGHDVFFVVVSEPDETTMYIMNKDGLMETVTTTDVAARMTDQGSLLGMRATQDGTTLFGDGTMGGVGNRPSAPPMHGGIQGILAIH